MQVLAVEEEARGGGRDERHGDEGGVIDDGPGADVGRASNPGSVTMRAGGRSSMASSSSSSSVGRRGS